MTCHGQKNAPHLLRFERRSGDRCRRAVPPPHGMLGPACVGARPRGDVRRRERERDMIAIAMWGVGVAM